LDIIFLIWVEELAPDSDIFNAVDEYIEVLIFLVKLWIYWVRSFDKILNNTLMIQKGPCKHFNYQAGSKRITFFQVSTVRNEPQSMCWCKFRCILFFSKIFLLDDRSVITVANHLGLLIGATTVVIWDEQCCYDLVIWMHLGYFIFIKELWASPKNTFDGYTSNSPNKIPTRSAETNSYQ
jgi:hypothetical protein